MGTQIVVLSNQGKKSYTGAARFAPDLSSGPGTVVSLAQQRITFNKGDNPDYPLVIDNAAFLHNKVLGARMGSIDWQAVVQVDRGIDYFITQAFGPRTGGILPGWVMSLIPWSGASPILASMIYWDSMELYAQFGVRGQQNMVMISARGIVLDPDNTMGSTGGFTAALTAPATEGTPGLGISSFANCHVGNGAASSPVTYDGIRRWRLSLKNGMDPDPSYLNTDARILNGAVPGPIQGSLSLGQLYNSANACPLSGSNNPITLYVPSGDKTYVLRVDTTASYDSDESAFDPGDFAGDTANYTVFGVNNTNNASAYPVAASYAAAA